MYLHLYKSNVWCYEHGSGKILLGVKYFTRTVRCLMMNRPPTLLILPTSRWDSSVHRTLPAGPFPEFFYLTTEPLM